MSRSGYADDLDNWTLIRWRGAVNSSIKGQRGQAFLRAMASALDSMPDKRLIRNSLVTKEGDVCALGSVARAKGIVVDNVDPDDYSQVADLFGISEALAREIVFENDEAHHHDETPEDTWKRVRKWVENNLAKPKPGSEGSK